MAEETPIYLFTGFMDAGKTTMIKETLFQNGFANECGNFLIICCEDGDEEYDIDKIKSYGADIVTIEEEEDFTTETLNKFKEEYNPEAVFIEYNGTWEVAPLFEMEYPEGWIIVQILSAVDANTFEMYMKNMRTMMQEQLFKSDVVEEFVEKVGGINTWAKEKLANPIIEAINKKVIDKVKKEVINVLDYSFTEENKDLFDFDAEDDDCLDNCLNHYAKNYEGRFDKLDECEQIRYLVQSALADC